MLAADQGIVLHYFNYSESSLILKVLTKERGLVSLLQKGVRRSKSKGAKTKFPPLSLITVEYYFSEKRDLHTARSVELWRPYKTLHSQIYKSSTLMFINELIYKTVRQEEKNDELYAFLEDFLLVMDSCDFNPNAHLLFMLKLTTFLGIAPDIAGYTSGGSLDLLEGTFKSTGSTKGDASASVSEVIVSIMGTNFDGLSSLEIPRELRKETLQTLVKYYEYQLEGIKSINSHFVLQELLG
jgi:DNA repair protein RecO (recombination protein O)